MTDNTSQILCFYLESLYNPLIMNLFLCVDIP